MVQSKLICPERSGFNVQVINDMVEINNISKSYDGIQALSQVSFSVAEGEVFGLIGADGAGKSTLFRILTSILTPDAGEAKVLGWDVLKDYRKIRQITGYMPGRFSLYQDLSVEENLQFFATVFGTTIAENYELVKDVYVQIEPFRKRRAGKLSGGMKQKLALSCCLIHCPKILVLDEPTTGVDAVSRKEFWELLRGLKQKGITIVVSTPYMDEALLCDRVALIQNGEILSVDAPSAIINSYEKQVISVRATDTFKLLKDLRKYSDTKHVYAFGSEVHFTGKTETGIDLLESYLINKGNQHLEIAEITPGIEDVFIDLMKVKE